MSSRHEEPSGGTFVTILSDKMSPLTFAKDLDILMTVAGYQSITRDVKKGALRYNPSGVFPSSHEHAKL